MIGLGMIYSSSYMFAKEEFGSSYHFFLKQFIFLIVGGGVCYTLSLSKFNFWYKHSLKINVFFGFLILLTFIPQVGLALKGSSRWIKLGFLGIQPGEFAKYSILLSSVYFFHQFPFWDKNQRIKNLVMLTFPMILLIFQPDFGMFVLCMVNILFVCFMSQFPRKWFYSILLSGVIGMIGILFAAPYRVKRLLSYLDPWNDPQNSGFQIIQSFLAFALGGVSGAGVGNSQEKLFYLPEAHNDFIFSVIGEEMGFIGILFLITLFVFFIYTGFRLALKLQNSTKSLFGITVIFSIGFQAVLNMGVVLGLLPTKGLNLPFISYGGSSLLANAILLGLFFSILKSEGIFGVSNAASMGRTQRA